MDKGKKTFIINSMRRATYRWPGRWLAEKRSTLGKGWFFCELCGTASKNKKKNFQMDHIHPVMNVNGWDGWEEVLDRMFADIPGWQRLCKPCHKEKTDAENALRPPGERSKKRTKKIKNT